MSTSSLAAIPLRRRKEGGLSFLEAGEGTALVLLHGIPGSALTWAPVGGRLAGPHRVVIPDLMGFGQSDPPDGDYYMESQARRVRALLDSLGIEELILGGHDFGGPVAVTLLRLYPELRLKALILSSTNLFTDTYVPPPLRLARVPWLGSAFFRAVAGTNWGIRGMYQAAAIQKAAVSWGQFKKHLTLSGKDLTWRIFQRSLADLETNYRAVQEFLSSVAVPALILWGDRDPFFSIQVAERSQLAIPASVLKMLPQTGHFVPEEQPDRVASEIRSFLALV